MYAFQIHLKCKIFKFQRPLLYVQCIVTYDYYNVLL